MRNKHEIKRLLLEAYKENYKKNPEEYKGAFKMCLQLGLTQKECDWPQCWRIHKYLHELTEEGYLEQKHRSGFRYKP